MTIYKFIVRNNTFANDSVHSKFSHGEANGYIAVPPTHPLYKLHYDEVNYNYPVNAHGGFTFSGLVTSNELLHQYASNADVPDDYWVLGFDTMQIGDNAENWSVANVEKELDRIEKQVLAIK